MRAVSHHQHHLEEDLLRRLDAAKTELHALTSELQRQQRLALLGTLAAGIAHETNNLLTPVLAYAQLAEARPDDPELLSKLLEKSLVGVRAATEIADAILGFASPTDRSEVAAVAPTVRKAIACLGRDPAKDGVSCRIDVPDGLRVRMSPLALQQVLLNLILNAIDAMKGSRNGLLRILASDSGDYVDLTVSDSGPGIDPARAETLFRPFSEKEHGLGGSGLGLWICRTLLEQAGGTITLDASSSAGATFNMSIPSA